MAAKSKTCVINIINVLNLFKPTRNKVKQKYDKKILHLHNISNLSKAHQYKLV